MIYWKGKIERAKKKGAEEYRQTLIEKQLADVSIDSLGTSQRSEEKRRKRISRISRSEALDRFNRAPKRVYYKDIPLKLRQNETLRLGISKTVCSKDLFKQCKDGKLFTRIAKELKAILETSDEPVKSLNGNQAMRIAANIHDIPV